MPRSSQLYVVSILKYISFLIFLNQLRSSSLLSCLILIGCRTKVSSNLADTCAKFLYWLQMCSQVYFRILMMIFTALHSLRFVFFKSSLSFFLLLIRKLECLDQHTFKCFCSFNMLILELPINNYQPSIASPICMPNNSNMNNKGRQEKAVTLKT